MSVVRSAGNGTRSRAYALPVQSIDIDAAAAEIEARRERWTGAGFLVGPLTWWEKQGGPLTTRAEVLAPYSVGVRCVREAIEFSVVLFAPPGVDMAWLDLEGVDFAGRKEVEVSSPEIPDLATFGRILDDTFDRWRRAAADSRKGDT